MRVTMKMSFVVLAGITLAATTHAAETNYDAVVSSGDSKAFTTVQAAIAAAPDDGSQPFRILVKPGTYQGQFLVPKEKKHIRLIGDDVTNTILAFAFNVFETNGVTNPKFKGIGTVVQGDDFRADNLTFQNTSGDHGQALALRVIGDRAVLDHCRMLGWQDTLRLDDGRDYLTNCYIEGRVDFIYGSAAAVFDRCEIHSKNGGFVTAANTPQGKPFGFVFMNCKLTGDPNPWVNPTNTTPVSKPAKNPTVDLGRPWRPYASVTYLNCWLGDHISPKGWNNWGNVTNETTARYAEYRSTGPGANPEQRVKWSKQLTDDEAKKLTVENILAGSDGWHPGAE